MCICPFIRIDVLLEGSTHTENPLWSLVVPLNFKGVPIREDLIWQTSEKPLGWHHQTAPRTHSSHTPRSTTLSLTFNSGSMEHLRVSVLETRTLWLFFSSSKVLRTYSSYTVARWHHEEAPTMHSSYSPHSNTLVHTHLKCSLLVPLGLVVPTRHLGVSPVWEVLGVAPAKRILDCSSWPWRFWERIQSRSHVYWAQNLKGAGKKGTWKSYTHTHTTFQYTLVSTHI